MIRDQLRRIAAIERGQVELPAAIRAWLGDEVAESETEQATAPCSLPIALSPDVQRWLDERTLSGAAA